MECLAGWEVSARMAEAFDPYYIWLGIPPEEQPADHYRLLGVRKFESNEEVIVNAADQRVRHLRSMQTGKRQAETQKLLNEISAASGVLLNPEKRQEYDAQLKAKESANRPIPKARPIATPLPVAAPHSAAPVPVPQFSAPPRPEPYVAAKASPRAGSKFPLVPLIAITVGRTLLACGWHAAATRINNSAKNRVEKFHFIAFAFRGGIAPTQTNYSRGYNSRTSQRLVIGCWYVVLLRTDHTN